MPAGNITPGGGMAAIVAAIPPGGAGAGALAARGAEAKSGPEAFGDALIDAALDAFCDTADPLSDLGGDPLEAMGGGAGLDAGATPEDRFQAAVAGEIVKKVVEIAAPVIADAVIKAASAAKSSSPSATAPFSGQSSFTPAARAAPTPVLAPASQPAPRLQAANTLRSADTFQAPATKSAPHQERPTATALAPALNEKGGGGTKIGTTGGGDGNRFRV